MLRLVENEETPTALRVQAAQAACPYIYHRKSTIQITKEPTLPSEDAIARLRDQLARALSNPIIDVTPAPSAEVVELPQKR